MKLSPVAGKSIYLEDKLDPMTDLLHDTGYSTLFILADSNTHQHCIPLLPSSLLTIQPIIIPAGESNKNLEQCQVIWDKLLQHGADRRSILINIGGGLICDLGGFAASCFQRGIRFAHVPTSLLAMTDAAIGGKTGVDFKGYKNYIGSFRNPEFIWIHRSFLNTLPEAEWMSGLAEIIKHAIVGSTFLWNLIDQAQNENDADWEAIIRESIRVKMKVVEADPEELGSRRILNFGHTIGHALESYFLHIGSPIPHGQAITYGMKAESKLAMDAGILNVPDFQKIIPLMDRVLPWPGVQLPEPAALEAWMSRDKKNTLNRLSFSLPEGLGSCRWDVTGLDPAPAIEWLRQQVSAKSFRLMSDPF